MKVRWNTNLLIAHHELPIGLVFHKHNNLPLGPIQAFISSAPWMRFYSIESGLVQVYYFELILGSQCQRLAELSRVGKSGATFRLRRHRLLERGHPQERNRREWPEVDEPKP